MIDRDTYASIDEAAHEIGAFCRKWGRINVSQTKEKFGTARVYCTFGIYGFHQLIWPGYHYTQWSRFGFFGTICQTVDTHLFERIIKNHLDFIIIPYQEFIYQLAYKKALKKYPNIKGNILAGADYRRELLNHLCSKKS